MGGRDKAGIGGWDTHTPVPPVNRLTPVKALPFGSSGKIIETYDTHTARRCRLPLVSCDCEDTLYRSADPPHPDMRRAGSLHRIQSRDPSESQPDTKL